MAYAGGFSGRSSCGTKHPPKVVALSARILRTSLGIAAELCKNKKLRIDECKERLRKRRRPDGEDSGINMSETIYKHKNM
jgi:hypothetical protein